jgi:predicted ATP-binding protein involved in virulence
MMQRLCVSSSLNVHRESEEIDDSESFNPRHRQEKPPIDRKIETLLKRLTEYQLQLEFEANNFARHYQYEVLSAMLYNEQFDTYSFEKKLNIKVEEMKKGLLHAYNDLEVLDPSMTELIDQHATKISESIANIERSIAEKKGITINDVLPISLLKRTEHIITLSTNLEEKRNTLFSQMALYLRKLNELLKTKEIVFDLSKGQRVKVKNRAGKEIPIEGLSSGEKQLFVLLTETLLQRNKDYVFFADEPELSLHISWQLELVKTMRELNPNTQLVIATHSPEVAAQWKSKIFTMEGIVSAATTPLN